MAKLRITYNSPVVLTFALASVLVLVLGDLAGQSFQAWFAAWPEFHGAASYVGLFAHPLGHANLNHLLANFTMILLLGPILEERHGSLSLIGMILITALVTGLINVLFLDTFLVGASGIVFMMILLASTSNIRQGEVPLTFIVVSVVYLGGEIYKAFHSDQVSQMAHLVGGLAGAAFGFFGARPASPSAAAAAQRTTRVAS